MAKTALNQPSTSRNGARLAGKTAIITGGAAGMGRATSLAFANEGASVTIFDIQKEAGEEVVGRGVQLQSEVLLALIEFLTSDINRNAAIVKL